MWSYKENDVKVEIFVKCEGGHNSKLWISIAIVADPSDQTQTRTFRFAFNSQETYFNHKLVY